MISVCHVYQEHTTPDENNDTATAFVIRKAVAMCILECRGH
jgi:hypothetical protein